jgi:hypothetical protein
MKDKKKAKEDKLVTIATFNQSAEAYLWKTKLESECIWSFVAGEYATKWVIPISGGIKLQVRESDAENAIKILSSQ